MDVRIDFKPFDDLLLRELYEVMVLRNRVFVVEQKITAEAEVDGLDPQCVHALMWVDERLVGTLRLFWDDGPVVKLGRVAVDSAFRGRGLGGRMMEKVQVFLGDRPAVLHAQAHLESWYERLGWQRRGPEFEEARIPHVRMEWNPGGKKIDE